MNIILSVNNKAISEIAANIGVPVYFNRNEIPKGLHSIIRYGSTKYSNADVTWNPGKSIFKSSNKKLCRELLAQSGVPVPQMTESLFPCIGRPEKHTRGRKFIVCRSDSDVRRAKRLGCKYFSQFYPKQNEYRVHIGSGKILFISQKVGGDHPFVWNHGKGYIFKVLPRHEWRPEVYRPAKAAIRVLGLDFGAVDVLADPEGTDLPIAVVCEVNTAPALEAYGVRKYSEYFEKILNEH